MDMTIISGIILPIILALKGLQHYFIKQCDKYLNRDEIFYKTIKNSSLIPGYISMIETFIDIRHSIKKQIEEDDLSGIDKWDLDLKRFDDLKEIHSIIEYHINRLGGRPEQIFRSTDNWEQKFNYSHDKLYEGMSWINELKSMNKKRDFSDCIFWTLFFLSLGAFLITIGLQVASINFPIFSIEVGVISFSIGIILLLLLIVVLIRFIFIKRKLQNVLKDATKYTI